MLGAGITNIRKRSVNQVNMSSKASKYERLRAARLAAIQASFQMESTGQSSQSMIEEFKRFRIDSGDYPVKLHEPLFQDLVQAVQDWKKDVHDILSKNLIEGWTPDRLDSVLRAILRIAIAEMLENPMKTPAPVIISEYVDLTRGFFGEEQVSYVNKALDQIARSLHLPLKKETC